MKKTVVQTESAPAAIGPYSQAVKVSASQMLFCSGQIAIDPSNQKMISGDVEAQTRCVLDNLSAVLGRAGFRLENVVKTTIFLADLEDFGKVNAIYAEYFDRTPPARATVEVSKLPKGALVEIDAIACR